MAGKSNYLEDAILNHILRGTTYTPPTNMYLSLHVGDPLEDDSGATEVDIAVDDIAYARQEITFAVASGGVSVSSNAQTFPAVDYGTGGSPITITHIGVYDASTNGNLLFFEELTPNRTLSSGEIISFDAGSVTVTED